MEKGIQPALWSNWLVLSEKEQAERHHLPRLVKPKIVHQANKQQRKRGHVIQAAAVSVVGLARKRNPCMIPPWCLQLASHSLQSLLAVMKRCWVRNVSLYQRLIELPQVMCPCLYQDHAERPGIMFLVSRPSQQCAHHTEGPGTELPFLRMRTPLLHHTFAESVVFWKMLAPKYHATTLTVDDEEESI